MNVFEVMSQAREAMTVRRVYGDPYEKDGVTIIPAANVRGGGGIGRSKGEDQRSGGYRINATPAGAYVIKDGNVKWQPAFNPNRVILGGQIIVALLVVLGIVRTLVNTQKPWSHLEVRQDNNMRAKRATDLFAAFVLGNGVLDLVAPRQRYSLWTFGPEALRKVAHWFADHPTATRLRGIVRIGIGLWLALRQYGKVPPEPWYQRWFGD
jgi:uncharacterized spore protein YtfJ